MNCLRDIFSITIAVNSMTRCSGAVAAMVEPVDVVARAEVEVVDGDDSQATSKCCCHWHESVN